MGAEGSGVDQPRARGARDRRWVGLVLGLPASRRRRGRDSAAAALLGGIVAFRGIPAFDPLGRVHWRLPERACAITSMTDRSADTARVSRFWAASGQGDLLRAGRQRPPPSRGAAACWCAGHTVAIHGVTHKKVHRDSQAAVERELETAIERTGGLGVTPARLYVRRMPQERGALRAADKLGCQLWAWSRGIWTPIDPIPKCWGAGDAFARARVVLLLHDARRRNPARRRADAVRVATR